MHSLTRFAGYSVVLVLVFLGAILGAQGWLNRETRRLRAAAVEDMRRQLVAATAVLPPQAAASPEAHLRELGRVVGATLVRADAGGPRDPTSLSFEHALPLGPGAPTAVRVSFALPAGSQLLSVHQRVLAGILVVSALTLCALVVLVALGSRGPERSTRTPWDAAKAEMAGLAALAQTSVAQGAELDREREVRRRAEQDAALKEQLLEKSLEEKTRLGRDLHDGIIQSLYAAGLTLESARALLPSNPAEADRRIGTCLANLNTAIRDVRSYIVGLAPENLRSSGFDDALRSLFTDLGAGREVEFETRIDEDATALLTPAQSAEALQIAREAVSNGLRHGRAQRILVRLHRNDREICLLVQDDGRGFNPARHADGHGLGNMRARAEKVGAKVKVESKPGDGARVVLTMPLVVVGG